MELSEEWQAIEHAIGARPKVMGKDIAEIRANVAKTKATRPPVSPSESLVIADIQLENCSVRTYKPKAFKDRLPLGIFVHGGGYCLGDLDTEEVTARVLADNGPMILVSVGYRLAPENVWPTSLNDCVASTHWAINHYASSPEVDVSKLFISGGSAGGQLALALSIKLIEQGHKLCGLLVLCPISVGPSAVPPALKHKYLALEENSDAPLVDANLYRLFMKANGHDDNDPYFSTLLNPNLKELPSVYLVTCGADVLRDDGYLLEEKLQSYGVQVKHDKYPRYPHYFWAVPNLKENDRFYSNLITGVKFLLSER